MEELVWRIEREGKTGDRDCRSSGTKEKVGKETKKKENDVDAEQSLTDPHAAGDKEKTKEAK